MSSNGANHGDSGVAANQLKITGLNEDCIVHIFLYLDYEQLIVIAHTNKELKPAADRAFKKNFGKMEFCLYLNRPWFHPKPTEDFTIYRIKIWLRLLRCFGHFIPELKVQTYKHNFRPPIPNLWRDLNLALRYIRRFCRYSLVKLVLCNVPEINSYRLGIFQNFPRLEHLVIAGESQITPTAVLAALRSTSRLQRVSLHDTIYTR